MTDQESPKAPTPETPPAAPVKKKSLMLPILVGAGVFVACIIFFSLKYGVFSSSNIVQPSPGAPVSAAKDTAATSETTEPTTDPYSGLFSDFEETSAAEEKGDSSDADSVAKKTWYENQKREIDQKLSELQIEKTRLEALKAEVDALIQTKKQMEEGNLTQMAKLYEGMATDELVPILNNLTDSQVSGLISRMKKAKASEVLGKLSPERAAKITQYILSVSEPDK